MATLPESPEYASGIYQIETSDPVVGGPGGVSNKQGEQLACRTAWLKVQVDGLVTGSIVAGKAARLSAVRTLSITGAGTGSAAFDGSANAAIALTLANSGVSAGTYSKVTVNAKGLVTAGAALVASDIPALDWSKITTGRPTTLGGYGITDALAKSDAVTSPTPNKLLLMNSAGQLPASITGNAATANKWAVARTLSISGDATGSGTLDGGANAGISVTLANSGVSAGTYTKMSVNSKGLVTNGGWLGAADIPALDASKITSGRLDLERLPLVSQGLATAVPTSVDPNSVVIPLVLTKHANGPVADRYYYIQTMFYPTVGGNAVQIAAGYAGVADMYVRYAYSATATTDPNSRVWSAWVRCDLGGAFAHTPDGELGAGVNLDSMIASGWWHQPFTANAKNGANYPVGEAGLLTVHAPISTMIYQTYRGYAAGGVYWRCRYNGTWSAWYRAWTPAISTRAGTSPSRSTAGLRCQESPRRFRRRRISMMQPRSPLASYPLREEGWVTELARLKQPSSLLLPGLFQSRGREQPPYRSTVVETSACRWWLTPAIFRRASYRLHAVASARPTHRQREAT